MSFKDFHLRPLFSLIEAGIIFFMLQSTVKAEDDAITDLRVRSEERLYALTFASKPAGLNSPFGHAFIIWQREDDNKQISAADAIGFYPKPGSNFYDIVFGAPGVLKNDALTESSKKITVLLNSDQYQRALSQKDKWEKEKSYSGPWTNCVTHVADITKTLGIHVSNGDWETPRHFIDGLENKLKDYDRIQKARAERVKQQALTDPYARKLLEQQLRRPPPRPGPALNSSPGSAPPALVLPPTEAGKSTTGPSPTTPIVVPAVPPPPANPPSVSLPPSRPIEIGPLR